MTRPYVQQFVPRSPAFLAEYGPDHRMVDEHNQPTTLDDGPGCQEIVLWTPPKKPTLELAAHHYLVEHIVPRGASVQRTAAALAEWMRVLDPQMDINTIKREHGRAVTAHVFARGCKPGTAQRIQTAGRAALYHEKREERIKEVVEFPEIPGGSPRIRWLTRDEHNARSEAIEELTWDRVDFTALTMDFRVPGIDYRNKRRAVVPIAERFAKRLYGWKQQAEDDYVIGLSRRGKVACTWKECKATLRAIGINEEGVARHVARHTVASWLLQGWPERGIAPATIFDVAKLLADTVEEVERTYGHLQPKHLQRCVIALPC